MFDFLKRHYSKPEPVFEVLGTDMHNHLIPKVDDGSKSMEMSLACIQTLSDAGYKKMYVTPHFQYPRFQNSEDDIERRFEELKAAVAEKNIPIEMISAGGEYRLDEGFTRRGDDSRYLTVGTEHYLLLELSLHQPFLGFQEAIYDFQMKGHDVILAHPERYPYFEIGAKRLRQLKDQGVMFQCNVLSLSGFYGKDAKKRALAMIEEGWVEFLGTDMHHEIYRQGLIDATHNSTVQKVLSKHKFLNAEMDLSAGAQKL